MKQPLKNQPSKKKPAKKRKKPVTKRPVKSKPVGRPSIYSQELADAICIRLMGGESLRKICQDDNMPHISVLFDWMNKPLHPFTEQYGRAREIQAEIMADDILDIADDASRDTTTINKNGTDIQVQDKEWTDRSKLRVEARLKLMHLLNPKRFNGKPDINIKTEKGVTNVQVNYNFPPNWTPPKEIE